MHVKLGDPNMKIDEFLIRSKLFQENLGQGTRLTVYNHFSCLRSLVVKGRHSALVFAREFGRGIDDLQCAVHGRVVVRDSVLEIQLAVQNAQSLRFLRVYPLVHWRRVVVEEPFHNESPWILSVRRVVVGIQDVVTV